MNILIIGYGSIGKRHESVLSEFNEVKVIHLVTKQNISNKKTFYSLEVIDNLNIYDYFIVASETNKHFEQLAYLESKVSNKIFFCEKPLFESKRELEINKNKVFVGYVLRFHPLLQKLKKELISEKVIYVNVKCGQYLPTWRPEVDYKTSYSSRKNQGGGVLLDLSHEIDYVQWMFGKVKTLNSHQLKISDLEIDSDDITTFIGKTTKEILINVSIDYISKIINRKISVHTLNNSYELDFIKNELVTVDKNNNDKVFRLDSLERNYMFKEMHKDILLKKQYVCSLNEGFDVMDTINMIQEQNK